ncbi:MAG: tryptophan-rich sensory protein [Thermomicrobiales bacterium]
MTAGPEHDEDQTAPIPAATVTEPIAPTESSPPSEPVVPAASVAGSAAARSGASARRVWLNRDSQWFWPLAGLVGYLLVLLMNFLANWIPFNGQMTGDVINKRPIPFQPAGWAFFIWFLIYILLGVYVVYTLTPGGQRSHRVRRIGGVFLVSCAANIVWLFLWHWEQFLLSLIAILVLWVSLLAIYILSRRGNVDGRQPSTWQKIAIQVPFSVYLGWASVATLANAAVWANRSWHSGNPFSDRTWAVVLLIAGVIVAAAFALFARDAIVPLVFVWAYIGIVQQQWDVSTLVVVVAVIGAIASAALTVAAYSLRFNPNAFSDLTPRRRRARTPDTPPTE